MILLNLFLLVQLTNLQSFGDMRTFQILEEVSPGTKIVNLGKLFNLNSDRDNLLAISDNQAGGIDYFQIDQKTFDLKVKRSPDRDEICSSSQEHCYIPLLILYGNRLEPSYDQISVEILDINDNTPNFSQSSVIIHIPESNVDSISRQTTIKLLEAVDRDTKENGVKIYRLDGSDSTVFKIEVDHKGPRLGLIEKLDREKRSSYTFKVLAIDGGSPSRTGTLTLTVEVDDINDNKPKFSQAQYKTIINEDSVIDTTVLTLHATDSDVGDNGKIGFRIAEPSNAEETLANRIFKVSSFNNTTCLIQVASTIDCKYHSRDKIEFYVEAYDHGIPSFSSTTLVIIQINDMNNNPPQIYVQYISESGGTSKLHDSKSGTLRENQSRSMIAQITVKDADKSIGNDISCKTNDSRFYLDEISTIPPYFSKHPLRMYRLFNNVLIDREKVDIVNLLLICVDNIHQRSAFSYGSTLSNSAIQLTSTELITIEILDENDEAPQFLEKQITFYLPENIPDMVSVEQGKAFSLGKVKATDMDKGDNAKIEYSIAVSNQNGFKINKTTGELSVSKSFDREQVTQLQLTVIATDSPKSGARKSTSVDVKVVITDENDCVPRFTEHNYHFRVSENVDHAILGTISATDIDEGENANIHYELTKVNFGSINKINGFTNPSNFHLDSKSGQIRLRKRLDREVCSHYDLIVIAVDNPFKSTSNLQNTATTNIAITVLDQNDNRPQIITPKNDDIYTIDSEQSTSGHPVFTVQAMDADYGNNATINYEIQSGDVDLFDLDRTTGLCFLKETLTDKHPQTFRLQIKAFDLGNPISLNTTINVRISRSRSGITGYHEKTYPKSSGFFTAFSVSDKTLVVILTTIFILLILITSLLAAFIRYRKVLLIRFQKKPDYCQGTVLQNYVKGKLPIEENEEILNTGDSEKYQNLFASVVPNNEKPTDKRRNPLCGYSEYGTLFHTNMGQTYINRNVSKIDPADYQALSQIGERQDTYQLPTSHVIINDPAIDKSRLDYKRYPLAQNMYATQSKRSIVDKTTIINNSPIFDDSNIPVSPLPVFQSTDAESSTHLIRGISEGINDITDNMQENKFSGQSPVCGSFVVKNLKAVENSPKKSVFGSFV